MKALLLACLLLGGCVSRSAPVGAATGNVDRLLAHPQFKAAAVAAPAFTTEALNTVAKLEHDLAIKP